MKLRGWGLCALLAAALIVQLTTVPATASERAQTNDALPQVVAVVLFDDIAGLPTNGRGCGLAGFRAYGPTLNPVTDSPSYTATATTEDSTSLPQTYTGTLDSTGYAVINYCPPAGVLGEGPFEVTFTATVQGATGTAVRTWSDGAGTPEEVVAAVLFDDVVGLPTPFAGGCGVAGFTAYTATGVPASGNERYTATATTVASTSTPRRYSGVLDNAGRGVLSYCPPAGLVTVPIEVTFTATVGAATGVAERAWTP